MRTLHRILLLVSLLIPAVTPVPHLAGAAQQYQGLCSVVKIEILQELTLERIGFLATLEVTNNEGDASITDFSAALTFSRTGAGGAPEDASDLFFVQPPKLRGVNDINGAGIINPGQTAHVEWFIIPKLSAGGTTPAGLLYQVGATLAGSLYGEEIPQDVFTVLPDTITVKPDPELQITYFQPRDVEGDNPFTPDVVESPIPFTLGVLVKNVGYGTARKVKIKSEQPRIVENIQDLLVVPQLLGARVDDQPTDNASLTVDLGDIEPGRCRKGAWDMITTLSGEFTSFKASYTHAPEMGGEETSLIRSVDAFFMVHEVLNDQPGRDDLLDFLAETKGDEQLIPDTLFESDCNELPVNRLNTVGLNSFSGLEAVLDVTADFEGWVFFRLDDPAQAKYPIARVVRSDGKVLNPHNYWTNIRYSPDNNARLTYLNIFDFVALNTYRYTVTYQPPAADIEPPVTTLRFTGPYREIGGEYYVTPDTQLFFTVEDASPVSTSYRLDTATGFKPAYPFRIAEAGTHLLEYFSQDASGNEELPHWSVTVHVTDGFPGIDGLLSDTEQIFIAGDSLSVRPTEVHFSFSASNIAAGATGRLEIYRGIQAYPTVQGVPSSPSAATDVELQVGGHLVDFYRYRLNGGAWSDEFPVSTPISLTGLTDGTVTIAISGRNRNGAYPPETEALELSWQVDSTAPALALEGLSGMPARLVDETLRVTGTEWYCYRLDNTFYQPNISAADPIILTRLAAGDHVIDLVDRGSQGASCPADVAGDERLAWTVDRSWGHSYPPAALVFSVDLPDVTADPVRVNWNGRNADGAVVPPGWYTAKVTISDSLGRSTSTLQPIRVGDMLPDGAAVTTASPQQEGHARGRWLVWQDQRNSNWDIYALDMQSGEEHVVRDNLLNQQRPRTDGQYVVWEDRQPDGTWDIWFRKLGSPEAARPITATPAVEERKPAIDYPWIVYQARPTADNSAPWQVMAYNMITGATTTVDSSGQDQLDPVVQRQRVVWQDFRDVGYGEIYMRDLGGGGNSRRITDDPGGQYHPVIFDHWIVWQDNRHGQSDLYGYNLKRGVEVRLTNTPEDETHPAITGSWVVYVEDSAGESLRNLRLLHLDNLASVQLTNLASAKENPAVADGRVIWIDRPEGDIGKVMAGTLPDLQAVFNNHNTVVVTGGMVDTRKDAYGLLSHWHRQAGVVAVRRYAQLLPTLVTETASWSNDGPAGDNFSLREGDFIWVRFHDARILDLGRKGCAAIDLVDGVNVISYSCFPDGYTAYQLVRELGPANINTLRVLDSRGGQWRSAVVVNGALIGEDFPIMPLSVIMIDSRGDHAGWIPGEGL